VNCSVKVRAIRCTLTDVHARRPRFRATVRSMSTSRGRYAVISRLIFLPANGSALSCRPLTVLRRVSNGRRQNPTSFREGEGRAAPTPSIVGDVKSVVLRYSTTRRRTSRGCSIACTVRGSSAVLLRVLLGP